MARGGVARLTTVPFGRAATDTLSEVIAAAKGGDPLAPVTVVVPGNLTGLALRRELGARPGGIVNVRFMVLDRVAELVGAGALAAQGRAPLDDAVRSVLVRRVLADRPAPLARVANAETTRQAVGELVDELGESERGALDVLRRHSSRGRALATIVDRLRGEAAPFYDEHDLAHAAAAAVRDGGADLRDIGQVVLHLPHRLTVAQLAFVDELLAVGRLWVLVGLTGEAKADTVASALVAHLEPGLDSALSVEGERLTTTIVVDAPDAPAEVRAALRIIASELERGLPLHRVGVVYRQREPYAALLDQELATAGIPMHGPAVRTLAQTVAGRTLLGAMSLADDEFSRMAVVRWMSESPLRVEDRRLPSATWARLARRAGVVRGPEQWTERLGKLAVEQGADALAAFVAWLVGECGVDERVSWAAWADWAQRFLRQVLGSPAARRRWPESELGAYDAVERVVEALRTLVDLDPGPIKRDRARAHLTAMFAAPAGRRGQFGQGVFCGLLSHVVGVDLDVVVVLGMDEASFPPVSSSAAVLSENERIAIGSPEARGVRATDERRTYLAATASATERWLLRPRVASGQLAHASSWWSDEKLPDNHLSIDSFDSELAHPTGAAGSIQERDLRDLHRWPRAVLKEHPLVESLPNLARGVECISARASASFSEWEGQVGSSPGLSIGDGVLSATALETWATCPAKYLFKQVLRLREHDEPGDVEELEARYRGTLVHRILERIGAAHLDLSSGDQLELDLDDVPSWTATAREVVTRVSEEVFEEFAAEGRAPYPILWEVEKARIVRDVLRTLDEDDGAILVAVEHRFGDEEQPFTLELSSGRKLRFNGSVDRVDRLHDRLRVIDYKTGSKEQRKNVLTALARGTRLQLPLYALAAREAFGPPSKVDADYWFISAKGGWTRVNIPIDELTTRQFENALEAIASGIEQGVFPANPGAEGFPTFDNCRFCDFERICPPDRDRAWDRLQNVPELKNYLELSSREAAAEEPTGAE